jgi:hypothetical protein
MNNFKPVNIIINFLEIAKINKEGIRELNILVENLSYQAPEIINRRFWKGTSNWKGISDIMNTYFPRVREDNRHLFSPEQIEENKKMEELYVKLLTKFEKHGFDK